MDAHEWATGDGQKYRATLTGIEKRYGHGSGWSSLPMGTSYSHLFYCAAEILRLAERVEALEKWVRDAPHQAGCTSYEAADAPCDCGLRAFRGAP